VLGPRNLFGGAQGIKVDSHGDEDSLVWGIATSCGQCSEKSIISIKIC
jgi:hypothetical protein